MRKHWFGYSVVFLIIALSIYCIWFSYGYKKFLDTPLIPPDKTVDYLFKPGASVKTLALDLHEMGLLPNPNYLIWLAYWKGITKNLHAGEYLFAGGITPLQLLDQISAGRVIYHRFLIVEGWNINQLMSALKDNALLTHDLIDQNPMTVMAKLGLPPGSPEGLFFPATYYFIKGTSDVALLRKAYQTMTSVLAKEWKQRVPDLPYQTPYQALIAASLVEKETAQTSEKALVAGVLMRRLQKNMPLQIDSTVIYGLGKAYAGKLSLADLRQDTPYNTYVRKGLPPTPIAMPGSESIHAVLHPANGDALYFVSKENGSHQFSVTLQAQNRAVSFYQINMRFPKVGKRLNNKTCKYIWYLSPTLQTLFTNHC